MLPQPPQVFQSAVLRLHFPSSIFCQFWLFFVFKFVVVLLVVGGGTVCLSMPPSWPEVSILILGSEINFSSDIEMESLEISKKLKTFFFFFRKSTEPQHRLGHSSAMVGPEI